VKVHKKLCDGRAKERHNYCRHTERYTTTVWCDKCGSEGKGRDKNLSISHEMAWAAFDARVGSAGHK
jgi:hypothetical protein